MKCLCGSALAPTDHFCGHCGRPAERLDCAECGLSNPFTAAFCAGCGRPLAASRRNPESATTSEDRVQELKFVTLLRIDMVQSTRLVQNLAPDAAYAFFEKPLRAMRDEIARLGGKVLKELGDGVIAAFGAPVSSDTHAVMACHAAIAIRDALKSLRDDLVRVRIGVHSDFVMASAAPQGGASVYELFGPAQHFVERVQAATPPDEIWVSENTRRLIDGFIDTQSAGAHALRGFDNPAALFRVIKSLKHENALGGRGARYASSRFAGREQELATLRAMLGDGRQSGKLVTLSGETGVGKSRLLKELIATVEASHWSFKYVSCFPTTPSSPFSTVRALLTSLSARTQTKSDYVDLGQAQLPRLWQNAVDSLLDNVFDATEWRILDPRVRGKAIIDAVCATIEVHARASAIAFIVEDLHWIDEASEPAVKAVFKIVQRLSLLAIATFRSEQAPAWLAPLKAVAIEVRPLSVHDSLSMLGLVRGPALLVKRLVDLVVTHAGGIPLFVEELCRKLADDGQITLNNGAYWVTKDVDQLDVPATLHTIIAARIDRMPHDAKTVLWHAAAIGSRLSQSSLSAVWRLGEERLASALLDLSSGELLMDYQLLPVHELCFSHELVRQVAYDTLVSAEKQQIHARILAHLETMAASSGADLTSLCRHARGCAAWDKASRFAIDIGRQCFARSAFRDAVKYYEVAFDALEKTPRSPARDTAAIDVRIEARVAFSALGQVERWLALAKEAEQLANAIGDQGRGVAAMAVRAGALNFFGPPLEAMEVSLSAVSKARNCGEVGWLGFSEYGLGQAYFIAGHYPKAVSALELALDHLSDPAATLPPGSSRQNMALLCNMMLSLACASTEDFQRANALLRTVQNFAAESSRPHDLAAAKYNEGYIAFMSHDVDAAINLFREGAAICERNDVGLFGTLIECNLGCALLENEQGEEAALCLRSSRHKAAESGYASVELRSAIFLARHDFACGRREPALADLNRAISRCVQEGYDVLRVQALVILAEMEAAMNGHVKAANHLSAAMITIDAIGARALAYFAMRSSAKWARNATNS